MLIIANNDGNSYMVVHGVMDKMVVKVVLIWIQLVEMSPNGPHINMSWSLFAFLTKKFKGELSKTLAEVKQAQTSIIYLF